MNSPNVDSALFNVTDVINQTLKTFIPTKIIYPCKRNKPWFNHELKTIIRKRTSELDTTNVGVKPTI